MAYESFDTDDMTVSSSTESAEQLAVTLAHPVVDETPVEESPEPEPETKAEPEAKVGKPRSDPDARVKVATSKEATAKRERDEAKAELDRVKAELAALKAPKPEPVKAEPPKSDAEPTVDQFDTYEKFVGARARWEARQELREVEAQRVQHEQAQAREGRNREQESQFKARYEAVLEADPEFESKVDPRLLTTQRLGVMADPSKATFGNFLIEQVFQSEQPKALLLHLSDREVVQRLATLPPDQVIRELARVEARVEAASPSGPAPVAISRAKPPIKPLGSSPVAASDSVPGDDESVEKHIAFYNAADRRQRRG